MPENELEECACSRKNCRRRGKCRACMEYHKKKKPNILPACQRRKKKGKGNTSDASKP